jgi:transcriptional regulator with XRE-family HTH domain
MSRGDGYDELYEAVGERIAVARRGIGMSQAKLAHTVGLTRASVVNIERGRQRPPLHLIWQIAAALNVEATRLIPLKRELDARGAPVQLDANVVAYIEHFAQNDPSTKRLLTDFIQRATSKIEGNDGRAEEEPKSAT